MEPDEIRGQPPEEGVVKSAMTVRDGLSRVIDFYSLREPHSDWERFRVLDIEEDLEHLADWLEGVLLSEPPGPRVTGLWFGLINPYRGGRATADIYVRGCA